MSTHDVQGWLNGEKLWEKLRKQYKLIALIAALFFLYILLGFQSVRQQHRLTDTQKEMLDAKYKYLTISAELVNETRPSQVAATLSEQGSRVRESNTPPIKIQ